MASPWMLALDASTTCSVVVVGRVDDGADATLHADVEDEGANQASARLHLRIAAALAAVGIGARELGAIACGVGPGTFTGTRVALATAKGLAAGCGLPLRPCSTLAAVAASVAAPVDDTTEVLALLDARRGEVYAASYTATRRGPQLQLTPRCAAIATVREAAATATIAIGPGVTPWADALAGLQLQPLAGPSPTGLWRAALASAEPMPAAAVQAVYLRDSYAELGVNTPRRPAFRNPHL
ncbi:MAG: tRNA (adenosine(37)-N6)-threonylcarbamoyltransferase complex dimerization subunit type 1 TsaB [Nannocystaceae bacterium]|nr:tRNA (adenosine(37)-N6)-threonylcarbamoyltransferase complex dimerization subunit type 1 TsaB [Nannocystaceae bacterium]